MSATMHDSGEREGDPRFLTLIDEMEKLHARKQRDYGTGDDPLANLRASEEWGETPAWVGAMMRGCDKVKRLKTFYQKGKLANEGVVDAFMDLAVYALLARILYEEAVEAGRAVCLPSTVESVTEADIEPVCQAPGCRGSRFCARHHYTSRNIFVVYRRAYEGGADNCPDFIPKALTDA